MSFVASGVADKGFVRTPEATGDLLRRGPEETSDNPHFVLDGELTEDPSLAIQLVRPGREWS